MLIHVCMCVCVYVRGLAFTSACLMFVLASTLCIHICMHAGVLVLRTHSFSDEKAFTPVLELTRLDLGCLLPVEQGSPLPPYTKCFQAYSTRIGEYCSQFVTCMRVSRLSQFCKSWLCRLSR